MDRGITTVCLWLKYTKITSWRKSELVYREIDVIHDNIGHSSVASSILTQYKQTNVVYIFMFDTIWTYNNVGRSCQRTEMNRICLIPPLAHISHPRIHVQFGTMYQLQRQKTWLGRVNHWQQLEPPSNGKKINLRGQHTECPTSTSVVVAGLPRFFGKGHQHM